MNNIIYLKKDPILTELDNSVDKNSAKKMIAFKYFNNNLEQLNNYLENTKHNSANKLKQKFIEPRSQLEFSF
tara:strand:- start:130 stop:345 length:216 start_codon:yes stop_codon:yes gene_type:complete